MKVMHLVNGINTDPKSFTWPLQVSPMVNQLDEWKAQPFVYGVGTLSVPEDEGELVTTFTALVKAYEGCEQHAACHSNGTIVVTRGIQASGMPIETLHLICGAIDADFEKNGLNAMLASGQIKRVFVYVAGKDSAMKIEDTVAGKLLFGMPLADNPLGLAGPVNTADSVKDKVTVIEWKDNDHSTCWLSENIKQTVEQIMCNANG